MNDCPTRPTSTAACRRRPFRAAWGVVLALILTRAHPLAAADVTLECSVIHTTRDGFYVDAGRLEGLRTGDVGRVLRAAAEIVRSEVVETARSTARLRLLGGSPPRPLRVGDRVVFRIDVESRRQREEGAGQRSPTLKGDGPAPFVPLLTLPGPRRKKLTESRDSVHGRIWLRKVAQAADENGADYSVTRLGTSGSYHRIDGTPWVLEWNGDAAYRDGHALGDIRDYRDVVLHVTRFSLFRRWDDRSCVRGGRFLPIELPAVGYLDGVQAERVLNDNLRVGGIAGFKPTPRRLDLSVTEPTIVPYVNLHADSPGGRRYSGTVGLLGSLHDGKTNRLALLLDQNASISSRLAVFSTCEVDFDVGGAETRSGVNLTHLDVSATYRLWPGLDLRGGIDHYELPDTRTERDLLSFEDDAFFDHGYWRSFAGARHELPWNLRLDEELSWIDSADDSGALHWRVSLTKREIPFVSGSSVTVSVYNLEGSGSSGLAGRIHARVPLLDGRLSIVPSFSYRTVDVERDSEDFDLANFTLGARWRISQHWSGYARFSRAFGTATAANIFDMGITYRW